MAVLVTGVGITALLRDRTDTRRDRRSDVISRSLPAPETIPLTSPRSGTGSPALLVRRLAALLKRRVAHAGSRQVFACRDRCLVRGGRLVLMCRGGEYPVAAGIGERWVAVVAHALRDGEGPLVWGFPAAIKWCMSQAASGAPCREQDAAEHDGR